MQPKLHQQVNLTLSYFYFIPSNLRFARTVTRLLLYDCSSKSSYVAIIERYDHSMNKSSISSKDKMPYN